MVCSKVLIALFLLLFGCCTLFSQTDASSINEEPLGEIERIPMHPDPNAHWYKRTVRYRWNRPDEGKPPVLPPEPQHFAEIRRAFDFWSRLTNRNYTEAPRNQYTNILVGYGNWTCRDMDELPDWSRVTVSLDKEALKDKNINQIRKLFIHEIGHYLGIVHNNNTDSLMHRDLDNIENKTLIHSDYQRIQMREGHRRPRRDDLDVCSTTHIDAVVPFEDNATLLVFVDRHWYSLNGTKQQFGLRSSFTKLPPWVRYVDAVLAVDNSLWLFSGNEFNKFNATNNKPVYTKHSHSVRGIFNVKLDWFGLPIGVRHVQAAFSLPSSNGSTEHYILAGGYSYKLNDGLDIDPSSKKPIEEKWINMPHHVNVAFSYNGELYFIGSDTKYTPTGELNEYGNPTYSMVEVMTLYTTTEHNGVYTLTESEENPNEFLFKLNGTDFAQNCNLK